MTSRVVLHRGLLGLVGFLVLVFHCREVDAFEAPPDVELYGAGSSIATELIQEWMEELFFNSRQHLVVDYDAGGSGAGVEELIAKDVDFAASEPLSMDNRERFKADVLHIPFTAAALTIAYNIPGLNTTLNLTADLIASIFQGNITEWNDPEIVDENPELESFTEAISIVVREDHSGSTYALTEYLSKASPRWTRGRTALPEHWPPSKAAFQAGGVANVIHSNEFSIGYVDLTTAFSQTISIARLKNRSGNFVLPSVEGVLEAQDNSALSTLPTGTESWENVSLVDMEGQGTWPISTFTYFLVYQDQRPNGVRGAGLVAFLKFVLSTEGYHPKDELFYANIAQNIIAINEATIGTILYDTTWDPDIWLTAYDLKREEEENSKRTLAIVGAVLGSIGGLAIVAVILALVYVKYSRHQMESTHKTFQETEMRRLELHSSASLKQLSDINIKEKIGQGKFGEVFLGDWMDSTKVALKTYNVEFDREAIILRSLNHPNIVQFFGIFKSVTGIHYIVMEYMNGGSLIELLLKISTDTPLYQLLTICMGACAGMMYLEKERVVHKDLACRNMLVSKNNNMYTVKVTDFGLAVQGEATVVDKTEMVPVRWSAPEVLESHSFSHLSDVWSFAVCMWEVFSFGKTPYTDLSNADVVEYVKSGRKLKQPSNCPDVLYEMWESCWALDLLERPTFHTLFKKIELLESMQPKRVINSGNSRGSFFLPETSSVGDDDQDIYIV